MNKCGVGALVQWWLGVRSKKWGTAYSFPKMENNIFLIIKILGEKIQGKQSMKNSNLLLVCLKNLSNLLFGNRFDVVEENKV